MQREKVGAIHVDRDRGSELPEEREFDRGALKVEKEQRRKLEKKREKKDGREHKEIIKVEKESELENELDAMERLPQKRKSARGIIDIVYHANACVLLHDESVFRFEHLRDIYVFSNDNVSAFCLSHLTCENM